MNQYRHKDGHFYRGDALPEAFAKLVSDPENWEVLDAAAGTWAPVVPPTK